MATRWTLAWPCFPVLDVDISTILHGRDLITTYLIVIQTNENRFIEYTVNIGPGFVSVPNPDRKRHSSKLTDSTVSTVHAKAKKYSVPVLAESRALHRKGLACAGTRRLEGGLFMLLVGHSGNSLEIRLSWD